MRNERGITLIALVLTIIIIFILSAAILSTLIDNDSIFIRVNDARIKTEIARYEEEFWLIAGMLEVDRVTEDMDKETYIQNFMKLIEDREQIRKAIFVEEVAPVYMEYFFSDLPNLEIVEMENIETYNVTSLSSLFLNCRKLQAIDLSNFDTRNVTDMSNMFLNCESVDVIDVSLFDTKLVTNMRNMFHGCKKLKELDVSSFDTREVTDMHGMFANKFDLESLDITNFATANVTDMSAMFFDAKKLKELDLTNFSTSSIHTMDMMFAGADNLEAVYVNRNWKMAEDSVSMFNDCTIKNVTVK